MYTHIKNADDLKAAIEELKRREQSKKTEIKQNLHAFKESVKPANLLKSKFNSSSSGSGIASTVIKAGIGMGVGILSKRLLIGSSHNFFTKLAGTAVKLGVAGVVAKKADQIKYTGLKLLTRVLGRKKPRKIMI